jgi:hypothetical protein
MLVIRKIISTTGDKIIAEIQVDTASELAVSVDGYTFANGSIAWVVQTGAFYGLSGGTWYNQDGTGAYS